MHCQTKTYGESSLLSFPVVVLVVISNFYLLGLTYALDVVKSAAGLYDQDKWVPLVQSVVNLGVSIFFGMKIGLGGIFLGTLVSTFIPLVAKPFIIYKNVFHSSPRAYFLNQLFEMIVAAALSLASILICGLVNLPSPLLQLLFNLVVTAPVSLGVFLVFHLHSPHLPSLFARVRSLIRRNQA